MILAGWYKLETRGLMIGAVFSELELLRLVEWEDCTLWIVP